MKVHYTGKPDNLDPAHQRKIDARFAKLAKLLDRRTGEKEAHVILTSERHLHNAEVTINYFDHPMVGAASGPDILTALTSAIEKLDKQIQRTRAKRRDTNRGPKAVSEKLSLTGEPEAPALEPETETAAPQVFRIANHNGRKPMTLDEAVLAMEGERDYVVFRDAETDRVSVLVRRRDGNFDLIEA